MSQLLRCWNANTNSSDRIGNGSARSVCVHGVPGPWRTDQSYRWMQKLQWKEDSSREEDCKIHIDKGMKDGQKITFHGEGDQDPGLETGHIIIVLDQKDHTVFTRQGDLFMCMDIQLVEALCGFQKPIAILDN